MKLKIARLGAFIALACILVGIFWDWQIIRVAGYVGVMTWLVMWIMDNDV